MLNDINTVDEYYKRILCTIDYWNGLAAIAPGVLISDYLHSASITLNKEDYRTLYSLVDNAIPMACPKEGSFTAYKIGALTDTYGWNHRRVLITLEIPSDAKRSSAFGRKCRCNKAIVKDIQLCSDLEIHPKKAVSMFDNRTKYIVGKWVLPDKFDEERFIECSHGIHFFMTIEEALDYVG